MNTQERKAEDSQATANQTNKFFVEQKTIDKIKQCVPAGTSLFPFQYSGVKFLVNRTRALIASDPGTGKTVMLSVAVNCVRHLRLEKGESTPLTLLVLCPKSMLLTWERELKKWLIDIKGIEYVVTNWDKLALARHSHKYDRPWDIVIADESHTAIKNPKAVRAKAFVDGLVPKCTRVWLSTATPASKSAVDYFMTLRVLLPTMMQRWSVWKFQKEFCNEVSNPFSPSGKAYEGFRRREVLRDIFSKCALRHKKEEVLPDLPEKMYSNIEVEVDRDIIAEHLDINLDYVIDCIDRGEPLPGHIAHVMQATAKAKIDDLMELLDNYPAEESLVIFAWHRAIVHEIVERLQAKAQKDGRTKATVAMITGEITSAEARQKIVDDFQAKRLHRLVLNMQSGGVGLTLTAAATAIYIEFPHSPIHLVQSENRVHRIGSKSNKVNIIRLVGKGTVDEAIFAALDKRIAAIKEIGV